jgi:hypothetical protein
MRVLDDTLSVVDSQLDNVYHRIVGDGQATSTDGVHGVLAHSDKDFVD